MSESTKLKISNSMRKIFSPPEISEQTKQKYILDSIIEFLDHKNNINSNINGVVVINSHNCIADNENNESTKTISILEYQQRLLIKYKNTKDNQTTNNNQ